MRSRELERMLSELGKLTAGQRQQVLDALGACDTAGAEVVAVIEARLSPAPVCPHCAGQHVVRNGQADGLQRYKCRGCGRTFNALCGTSPAVSPYLLTARPQSLNEISSSNFGTGNPWR